MKKNDVYSHMTINSLKNVPIEALIDTYIQGSSFYQQVPYADLLPDLRGGSCELLDCNVDNCKLPEGYKLTGTSTNKHFLQQKDKEFWIVDESLKPIAPRNPENFDAIGISKDPKNIPSEMCEEPLTKNALSVMSEVL